MKNLMTDQFCYSDEPQLFDGEVELLNHFECFDEDMADPAVWPVKVQPAKTVHLKLNAQKDAEWIAEWLFEAWLDRDDYSIESCATCTGAEIVDRWLENYYDCCEWYDGPSNEAMPAIVKAEQQMQAAIDWWMFWNVGLMRLGVFDRLLDVRKHSIGLTVIEQAIEKAEQTLTQIDLYWVPDYKNEYEVEYPEVD